MKHSLKQAVASILCASLLGGAVCMVGCATADTPINEPIMNRKTYSFDLLASEKPEVNSTVPIAYMDLTAYYSFAGTGNMTVTVTEGSHTTFTATADDPIANLYAPSFKPSQCKSVAIIYRTDMNKDGEFYANRSDGVQMGQKGGVQIWRWIPTKEFAKIAVVCEAWKDADESVSFTGFRFDPLNPRINKGDSIDIRCIAFFDTEDGAEKFNYDEYKKLLDWEKENSEGADKEEEEETGASVEWADPAYKDMNATPEDTRAGSLTFTESADGSTVTVSYEVNGETRSYTVPNDAINRFGGYAGTDDLGRSLYDAGQVGVMGEKGERLVGMFYFLWHGKHPPTEKVYNLQEILDSTPSEDRGKLSTGKYGQVGVFHWFGEPLYGYYYINDEWVLRKHMELLTNAGVDFLFFDTTNNHTHADTALKIMRILHEMNEQGYDAPKVTFYTNTDAEIRIRSLYNEIYAKNHYPDTWLTIDGKPVMIGPADANIDDFFTMKINQWPTERENHVNAWPWMDGRRPQYVYKDEDGQRSAMNVSVAQHSSTWRFSDSLYDVMDRGNLGRSYGEAKLNDRLTAAYYKAIEENPELYKQGLNFQAQWDAAHKANVPYVLVTGWNEWIAQLQSTSTEYAHFVDLASVEFSRDIEMMKGGYFDNYYMQLVFNIQKYKGASPIILQDARLPINVTGGFEQWDAVTVTYTDYAGDCRDRDFNGYGGKVYTDTTGRNDLVAFKITHDTQNVYFYAETRFDITKPDTESSWMQLWIDADQDVKTGWYGYDYIVNYAARDEFTTTVAKYNGADNAFSFEVVGEVSYRVKGNQMMIAVPLELLGVQHCDYMNFHFKWVDSDSRMTTMEQLYTEGDVAPLGRLNYVFNTVMPGSVPPEAPETEASTEGDTSEESSAEDVTDTPKKGCGSSLLASAAALTASAAALAVGLSKKKENE